METIQHNQATEIVDGPGKFDLMLSLFEDKKVSFVIIQSRFGKFYNFFRLPVGRKIAVLVKILSLTRGSTFGEDAATWDFAGFVEPFPSDGWANNTSFQVSGQFNCKTRKGYLSLHC